MGKSGTNGGKMPDEPITKISSSRKIKIPIKGIQYSNIERARHISTEIPTKEASEEATRAIFEAQDGFLEAIDKEAYKDAGYKDRPLDGKSKTFTQIGKDGKKLKWKLEK